MHLPRGYLKQAYEAIRAKGGVCIMDEVSLITLVCSLNSLCTVCILVRMVCKHHTHTTVYCHCAMSYVYVLPLFHSVYHTSKDTVYYDVCIVQVQTGFGRLGSHYWAFEDGDVEPDIGRRARHVVL